MNTNNIIAEIANVHEGEFDYFKKIATEIVSTGFKNIKFQYIIPLEFGDPGSENYIELNRLHFKHEQYLEVAQSCKDLNIFYDVFGKDSYEAVKKLSQQIHVKGIKFHTTNSMDFNLINEAAQSFDLIFVSISGITAIEINELVQFIEEKKIKDKIIMSYGVQNYPTQTKEIRVNKLTELKKIFNIKICLTDHIDGDNDLAKEIVTMALAMGYDYVEKHVTLDRSRRLDDDHAALNISEFKVIFEKINTLSDLFTDNILQLSNKEMDYRNKSKKIIHVKDDIKKGTTINTNLLHNKRQDGTLTPNFLNIKNVIGKKASKDLTQNTILKIKDIENTIYGIIIVRASSNRLKSKCFLPIGEHESIRFLVKRLKESEKITSLIIATTDSPDDDAIEKIANEEGINCVRGSEKVCERIEKVFQIYGEPDIFLRLTGDNVFVDPKHIDNILDTYLDGNYDYYRHEKVIDGCDFEIIKSSYFNSLKNYYSNFNDNSEYMTLYLRNNYAEILAALEYQTKLNYIDYRFTLDYKEDIDNIQRVYKKLNNISFSYNDLCNCLNNSPEVYQSFIPENKALGITIEKKTLF